jgi:hypothetical protein
MNENINIDEIMNQFRLATREVFNHYFRVPDPYNNDGWILEERFSAVQVVLFQKLVMEPAALSDTEYGYPQSEILVELRYSDSASIMINREVKSSYWDFPVKEITRDARLLFVSFFDWDEQDYKDNRYVCLQIDRWPLHPETIGKHALIESQYVRFVKAQ